ncbi:MAG: hypothetical protein QOI41_7147 [Myxococcales bacterium]|nr:hypothetical protein [Myxococcales bacterium]
MAEGRTVRSICVFCGSRPGSDPAFGDAAAALGAAIAKRGITLVYGGAKVGLMGRLADAALAGGGQVVGVIPRGLVSKEIAHDGLQELFLTDSMHERKDRMILLSDAFISLPGGWGTYDELFEVLTLAQIGVHDKPSGFLNVNGYFDPLLTLLRHTIAHRFAAPQHEQLYVTSSEADALLDALIAWHPPPLGDKWNDRRAVVPGQGK